MVAPSAPVLLSADGRPDRRSPYFRFGHVVDADSPTWRAHMELVAQGEVFGGPGTRYYTSAYQSISGEIEIFEDSLPRGIFLVRCRAFDGSSFGPYGPTSTYVADNPPTAPSLVNLTRNERVAAEEVNRARHAHFDSDGDGQAAFEHRHRLGAAAWVSSGIRETVNQFYDLPAGLQVGTYERQVRTASIAPTGALAWGPWSESGFFVTANRPPGPTFVSPINGGIIGAATVQVQVSAAVFDTLELQVLDAQGVALTQVLSSTTGDFTVTDLANSQTVTLRARAVKDALAGAWTTISALVSFTPPPAARPTLQVRQLVLQGVPVDVGITVTPSIPPPTGGEPTPQSYAVLREELRRGVWVGGVLRRAQAVSPVAAFHDLEVASGVPVRYRVRVDAPNGTSSWSDYVDVFSDPVDLPDPLQGVFSDDVFSTQVFD